MKKGEKYLTKTDAVHQNNQQTLNNRIVTVDEVSERYDDVICRVDFDDEDSVYLPFAKSELIPINNHTILKR